MVPQLTMLLQVKTDPNRKFIRDGRPNLCFKKIQKSTANRIDPVGNTYFGNPVAGSGNPVAGSGLTSKVAAAIVMVLFSVTAANARLSTKNYSCSDLKDLVFQQGAIVLNTKNSSVYMRFVADRSFCEKNEAIKRISVPSKSEKCRLNHCVERNIDNDN